ncbi:hypothetical protein Q5424_18725 [Conexibacter sp. JD483]|uniref:hypothetical protein n=1 Tax=unclassified Conexibacter TaxID=2627773 RepID=UPI002722ACEC|nr:MULTISPECIES: hypothetical protein [unclassified Conexibacter]MDO8186370.1 hypothetical protein [Conexibacter sp. CPCC 205706]MDO8199769.1 hypothetical protein [Conexibacter sp. CPCC 205762]MDR9371138.1 hypothetical protein [Conexibacter sp. JD483]
MSDVLDTIEWELLAAIRRSNARRRRRRWLGFAGGGLLGLTVATAGVAGVVPSALDRLVGGNDAPSAGIRAIPGAPRATLSLDDAAGNRWSLSLHRTDGGFVVLAALPDELPTDRFAPVNGYSPLGLAAGMQDSPLALIGPVIAERDGTLSRLLIGEVEASARSVTVAIGGERYAAQLTPQQIVAPITRPPEDELLPAGRALLKRLGDEIRLRGFAVALPAGAVPAGADRVEGTVEIVLDDGTTASKTLRPTCVSPDCGERVYELPDQDG